MSDDSYAGFLLGVGFNTPTDFRRIGYIRLFGYSIEHPAHLFTSSIRDYVPSLLNTVFKMEFGIGDKEDVSRRTVSVIVNPTTLRPPRATMDERHFCNFFSNGEVKRKTAAAPPPNADETISSSDQNSSANRMSYPREFKLLVINYYHQNGQNKYRTCKEFQITKSMLNGWLLKVDKIRQSRPGSLKSGRSGRKPQFPAVEKRLFEIYQSCLKSGKKVGNRWLRDTAKLIAREQCRPDELAGMCQFSERWLCNFKKRYGINLTKDWSGGETANSAGGSQSALADGTERSVLSATAAASNDDVSGGNGSPRAVLAEKNTENTENTNLRTLKKWDESDKAAEDARDDPIDLRCPYERKKTDVRRRVGNASGTTIGGGKRPVNNGPAGGGIESGRRGRKVQFPQVEKVLYEKLAAQHAGGLKVSNRWLQDEARRLAVELCPEMFTDAFKSARCMFSEHWLHNFKKRYGISLRCGQENDDRGPIEQASVIASNGRRSSASDQDIPLNLTIKQRRSIIKPIPTHCHLPNFAWSLYNYDARFCADRGFLDSAQRSLTQHSIPYAHSVPQHANIPIVNCAKGGDPKQRIEDEIYLKILAGRIGT